MAHCPGPVGLTGRERQSDTDERVCWVTGDWRGGVENVAWFATGG